MLGIVMIAQVTYPGDHVLPGVRMNGQTVSGKSRSVLKDQVQASFTDAEVVLTAADMTKTIPLPNTGAVVATEKTLDQILDYPLWQRLIPFSFLVKQRNHQELFVEVNEDQLSTITGGIAEELSKEPRNAGLAIDGGALTTTRSAPGQKVEAATIQEALHRENFRFGQTSIAVVYQELSPAVSDDDIAVVRAQAEESIKRQLVIVAEDGREFIPTPSDIAAWLTVAMSDEGKPHLAVSDEQLAAYIGGLNKKVGVTPGVARATVVDGREVARTSAPSGLAIAAAELQKSLADALFDRSAPQRLSIRMVSVSPTVTYDRSYTSSQSGLQAYIDFITGSENVKIAVSEIGGRGWSAKGRGDEQTVAASTYKLYVAYMLFKQVADGKLQWGSPALGTDVAGCFERMIVLSDNPCAEHFISLFDANAINAFIWANGISRSTTFISQDAAQTTASDLEKLLRGIETGSMIQGNDRAKLLDAMSRQKYRAGVPAGSRGTVYDKVGFLWDYINDAAIVKHPKGTYTLVVLTKGASWGKVAEITRQIEQILYP